MAPRKIVATAATVALAGTAGLVAFAPSASAAPVDYRAHCTNQFLPAGIADADIQMDIQVTPQKATYAVGDKVTVTWHWVKNSVVPVNTPLGIHVKENTALPKGVVLLTGAQTSTVAVEGPRVNPDAAPGEVLKLSDMTAELTLAKAGDLNLAPGNYSSFVDAKMGLPNDVETACSPVTPVAPGTTIKVEGSSSADPTVTATPAEVNAGGSVALAGDNWAAGTPTAELCAADGTACDPAKISATTLTIADGKLTGNVTIAPSVASGDYKIKVKAGGGEALSGAVKVTAVQKQAAITPDHGPLGTVVTATGTGYEPGGYVYITTLDATNAELFTDYVEVGADGKFSKEITVDNPDTKSIGAYEITPDTGAIMPFRITIPGRDLSQTVTGGVLPGTLTIAQQAAGIKLSDITINGAAQNMTGALNPVTVKDYRGGATGWTLTGSVSDFTNGTGGKITGDKFTWTPKVTNGEGSPSTAVAGSTGPIGTGATLASAPNAATGTGGTFTADADLSLAVPAYQQIGTYNATLTLSIS
jgi:hypothetical protein